MIATEDEGDAHGQLVEKTAWKKWQRNIPTQLQNAIHAVNFHADDMSG
jgi:hypothetical protein